MFLHKYLISLILLALGLIVATLPVHATPPTIATFAQSLHGGCFKTAPNLCRIHVDPFTIPVNAGAGERVAQFRILANNTSGGTSFMLWEFSTSSSYAFKPVGNYTPALPAENFVAACGQTYNLSIQTRGDTSTTPGTFGNAGITADFTCPN